ncbi:MAG TPA: hypothetical protein VGJ84_19995, partial [Polyangiaceae bacterium]
RPRKGLHPAARPGRHRALAGSGASAGVAHQEPARGVAGYRRVAEQRAIPVSAALVKAAQREPAA